MSKYCTNCGRDIKAKDVFCQYCGNQIIESDKLSDKEKEIIITNKNNSLALAGFIVSLVSFIIGFWGITAIVGIVLSSVGLSQIKKTNEGGKNLAIAGIIIGAGSLVLGFLSLIFMLFLSIWA